MASLYEISLAWQNLNAALESEEHEFGSPEYYENIKAVLSQIEGDFHEKAENVVKMARQFELEADLVDAEIKRLQARKKTLTNKSDTLRAGLKGSMEVNGVDKIKSTLFDITLSKPTVGAVVLEIAPEELPEEFQKVKIEADKTALKEALKAGQVIEGAYLEEVRTLRIR